MRESNRFQSEIAFPNDEIPEATKGSLTLTLFISVPGGMMKTPMNELYNLLICARGYYYAIHVRLISTRLQLFTIHPQTHTVLCVDR